MFYIYVSGGRDSSVGIATRYGLDGPGIESRWGRDFPHPSRPLPTLRVVVASKGGTFTFLPLRAGYLRQKTHTQIMQYLLVFPRQQWLHEYYTLLRLYVHCLFSN